MTTENSALSRRYEVDLSAVDATFVVQFFEEGSFGPPNERVSRQGTAIRHDVANLDLRVGCTGLILLLGKCAASAGKQNDGGRKRRQLSRDEGHFVSPYGLMNYWGPLSGFLPNLNTLNQTLSMSEKRVMMHFRISSSDQSTCLTVLALARNCLV